MMESGLEEASEIEAHVLALRRFALALTRDRDLADDLVQDTIERALSRWRLRRRDLPLRPWLFAILRNLHVSAWRRRVRSSFVAGDRLDEIAAVSDAVETRIELRQVLEMLENLPEDQRMAILLVAVEGLPYAQAAAVMDVPVGTVMSRLGRARARLREMAGAGTTAKLRRVV